MRMLTPARMIKFFVDWFKFASSRKPKQIQLYGSYRVSTAGAENCLKVYDMQFLQKKLYLESSQSNKFVRPLLGQLPVCVKFTLTAVGLKLNIKFKLKSFLRKEARDFLIYVVCTRRLARPAILHSNVSDSGMDAQQNVEARP